MLNRYPLWKNILLVVLIFLGILYALPNLFGEDPAVQVSTKGTTTITDIVASQVQGVLDAERIPYLKITHSKDNMLIRFPNTDSELKAKDVVRSILGDNYIVAVNLAPRTPAWLRALGAQPMKLGLDLMGGVNFLLDVDVDSVIKARISGDMNGIGVDLRQGNVRYTSINAKGSQGIVVYFRDANSQNQGYPILSKNLNDYTLTKSEQNGSYLVTATLTPAAWTTLTNYAVEQDMGILTNRVNELGVSEAVVQRQGKNLISVDLPGVQDTARAKDLLGKAATLKFQMVDMNADPQSAAAGAVPLGDTLYTYQGQPVLLKNQVILTGSSITYATTSTGQNGLPAVQVRLGGGGESLFSRTTAENVGKSMAVVYVESTANTQMVNGKPIITRQQTERVINIATIQSALGNTFEITGLTGTREASNLALLLRSGALSANLSVISERTVGPSLGAANIHKGVVSVIIGALLVILFMAFYYRIFGLVADLALVLNLVFIVAILSILGATLTLPGIAGMLLTVGMAVDANVLINERIREELRNGMSPQASIHAGYERAFVTIVDSNMTTLIVALVLFALGSSTVKSFAITLTIGILTSMVTANFFTRAVINWIYGGRAVKWLSIGIKPSLKPPNKNIAVNE